MNRPTGLCQHCVRWDDEKDRCEFNLADDFDHISSCLYFCRASVRGIRKTKNRGFFRMRYIAEDHERKQRGNRMDYTEIYEGWDDLPDW